MSSVWESKLKILKQTEFCFSGECCDIVFHEYYCYVFQLIMLLLWITWFSNLCWNIYILMLYLIGCGILKTLTCSPWSFNVQLNLLWWNCADVCVCVLHWRRNCDVEACGQWDDGMLTSSTCLEVPRWSVSFWLQTAEKQDALRELRDNTSIELIIACSHY